MDSIRPNPRCGCRYCRMAGLVFPAVLVTMGLLFLLMEFHAISIQRTWPVLPLVIGAVKLLQRSASVREHVPIGYDSASAAGNGVLPRSQAAPPAASSSQPGRPS